MDLSYEIIEQWAREGQEESLHLEFKELERPEKGDLTKEDRKRIAKAVCGMCNAEGGAVVLGVKTTKKDGLDVAVAIIPIANSDALVNRVKSSLPDMLSPQHLGIQVRAFLIEEESSRGVVVIDVPPSDLRPHMSVPEHRYFRRGSDGTRMMEHGEVRDAFLAPRQGALELDFCFVRTISYGFQRFEVPCLVGVKNIGRVPARAPYLISKNYILTRNKSHSTNVDVRRRPDGGVGLFGVADLIVHIDESLYFGQINIGLFLHGNQDQTTSQNSANNFMHALRSAESEGSFSIGEPHMLQNLNQKGPSLGPFCLDVEFEFGSETIPKQSGRLKLSNWELFDHMTEQIIRS